MFGFINIYKPEGITSFDVIARLRKVLHIKQIGHTGTLDPFAVGVLPICIGKSTKLIEYLPDDKQYLATIQFGSETDTCDKDGQITKTFDKKISKTDLQTILKNFKGEIEQIPPIYSAIKINGKKLYEYARKGEQVEIKPRKVLITEIELKSFDYEQQCAKILISCSKGTYIRAIARDIGRELNCGGHLIELERTKAGNFSIENSIKLKDMQTIEDVEQNLINPIDVICGNFYTLNDKEQKLVSNGMGIKINQNCLYIKKQTLQNHCNNSKNTDIVFLIYSDKMYGIGIIDREYIKIKKVFGEL